MVSTSRSIGIAPLGYKNLPLISISNRIYSFGSLPWLALPRLHPFVGSQLNPLKLYSDASTISSKTGSSSTDSELDHPSSSSSSLIIDPRNGFCIANSTFYSKRNPLPLPASASLDVTTFISSQAHRGVTAFVEAATGHGITFSDLWRAVDRFADCLHRDFGIGRGDVVLILSPNSISIPQIRDNHPKLAFTTRELAYKLADSISNSSVILTVEEDEEPVESTLGVEIVGFLSEMMNKEPCERRVRDRVDQDDTAMLLYSSGTTGRSKGVISSHGNLIAHVARFIAEPLKPNQIFLCTVPMFHTFGLLNYTIATIALGSTVVILRRFDLHEMMAAVEKYKATALILVPPVLVAMINGSDLVKAKYDLASLKTVTESFKEKYPTVDIFQGYALTESNGAGASIDSVAESRRYGAAGLLSCGAKARIVDPDTGRVMGVNQTGELWLKDPRLPKVLHNFGSPAELEALLLSHPDIRDAAVIPFPDKEAGQCPMAYVARYPESDLSERQVIDFISKQVAPYKKIRKVAFIDTIPKTPSGKTLRKDLIKLATSKL
ncbi:unnamed protein product [Cochlearia groenlandica]